MTSLYLLTQAPDTINSSLTRRYHVLDTSFKPKTVFSNFQSLSVLASFRGFTNKSREISFPCRNADFISGEFISHPSVIITAITIRKIYFPQVGESVHSLARWSSSKPLATRRAFVVLFPLTNFSVRTHLVDMYF